MTCVVKDWCFDLIALLAKVNDINLMRMIA